MHKALTLIAFGAAGLLVGGLIAAPFTGSARPAIYGLLALSASCGLIAIFDPRGGRPT